MYKYLGRQQNGHLVKGRVSSKSIFDALEQIKSKGISPIAVDRELRFLDLTVRSRATSSSDLIFFTRQLSSFLKKSFSLSECLILISVDMERAPLREALFNVAEDIERGESFNNALLKYPLVFPQVFTGIISVLKSKNLLRNYSKKQGISIPKLIRVKRRYTLSSILHQVLSLTLLISLHQQSLMPVTYPKVLQAKTC